jgi:hypothetical protein
MEYHKTLVFLNTVRLQVSECEQVLISLLFTLASHFNSINFEKNATRIYKHCGDYRENQQTTVRDRSSLSLALC